MRVREHSFPVSGWCVHCAARQIDGAWTSECVEREDWQKASKPIPDTPRMLACESGEDISVRMAEIRSTEVPYCERTKMSLYNCLRSPGRCPPECERYHDWIGPNEDGTT